jgi:hypothetical protein
MNQKKWHYEINGILKRKTESVQHVYNTQYLYLFKMYIKCNIWRVAVRPSYI